MIPDEAKTDASIPMIPLVLPDPGPSPSSSPSSDAGPVLGPGLPAAVIPVPVPPWVAKEILTLSAMITDLRRENSQMRSGLVRNIEHLSRDKALLSKALRKRGVDVHRVLQGADDGGGKP